MQQGGMIEVSGQGKLRGTGVSTKRLFDWGGWKVAPGYAIHAMGGGGDVGIGEWLAERTAYASLVLRECVEVDPKRRGGIPVLKGTRFTLAQLLAELAEGRSLPRIAEDFELDLQTLEQFMRGLSICLDRPAMR